MITAWTGRLSLPHCPVNDELVSTDGAERNRHCIAAECAVINPRKAAVAEKPRDAYVQL